MSRVCSSKRFKDLNCNCRGVNIDILDSLIWHTVVKEGKLKEHIIEQHNKAIKDSSNIHLIAKRDKLNKELLQVDKQLLNSFDLMTNTDDLDDDTRALFSSRIIALQKSKKVLKNDLESIKKELMVFDEMTKNIDVQLEGFTRIENYKNLTHELKRESLLSVIDTIKIMDLKESKHTFLLVNPKLAYEVKPMIVIMNYSKDYALVENFDTPFVYFLTSKGEKKYKDAKIVDVIDEARHLQVKYAIEKS